MMTRILFPHRVLGFVLTGLWLCGVGGGAISGVRADEGMFPISELAGLDLPSKGLRIPPEAIFQTDGVSLVDGICRVNGCTGSFVSSDGLIITNHHCAYRAIQTASSAEHDYLRDGFLARTRGEEVTAPGYTVRITESYSDVSDQVLGVVNPEMTFLERSKAIEQRRKEIESRAEQENPGLRAEVAEMFLGKTYVLFLYTFIKDVRLVFAPPESVGAFGGDVDNWEWPRHTGDFSFLRAYVAPDGSSAEYAAENVPYRPKRFIQVEPRGVQEEDYVMLLGYPGRTARHLTSHFLTYERDIRLPHVVDLYRWEIDVMEEMGQKNRAVALKHASRIQGLANVEKRSRGQLKGLARAGIVEARQVVEDRLQAYIEAQPERAERYGKLLEESRAYYDELRAAASRELNERALTSTCRTLNLAFTLYDAAHQRALPDLERESAFMERNYALTMRQATLAQKDLEVATDHRMLAEMLRRLAPYIDPVDFGPQAASEDHQAQVSDSQIADFVAAFFSGTQLQDPQFFERCTTLDADQLLATGDPAFAMISRWYPRLLELREIDKERDGRLGRLYGDLQTIKREFLATEFIPDANGTLRLTFGYVRGFSPEDAIIKTPFTTLKGLIDKTTGVEPFVTPLPLLERYATGDFGGFVHPKLKQVPIALLYSTDTTGGNSGSPILNADGNLIGVNFDRCCEATINDFAWNENYSRSIGVDIRYVLWITGKVFGGEDLLTEMGVTIDGARLETSEASATR